MKKISILAIAALVAATGAVAAEPAAGDSAPAAEDATKEKKICKTEKITGSLTRVRRTCLTKKEWDRLAAGSREGVEDIIRDAGRVSDGGGSGATGF